ncbi:MAG: hypothetical protein JRI53_04470 [Deltaproteobacteria bacterium]|nr:hypothetical protein [Deltaproteobacteria bacterium]
MSESIEILEAKALAYFYVSRLFTTSDPDLSDLIHDLGYYTRANDTKAFFATTRKIEQHLKEKCDE